LVEVEFLRFSLKHTQLALRNSTTRIAFRYGSACLTACPQAVLAVTIETPAGLQCGYSGDCLPPSWFDKTPGVAYSQQIDDMLAVTHLAVDAFLDEAASPVEMFPALLAVNERVHRTAGEQGHCELLASFGVSMVERAVMDALARAAGMSFAQAVRSNLYAISPGEVHGELAGFTPADWLPVEPLSSVFVRHTVGLGDQLTAGEIPAGERLDDGFPQALEQYIEQTGTRYFKVKVSNQLDVDRDRLATIAALCERHLGADYRLTLDGNEQYTQIDDLLALLDSLRAAPGLATLLDNILCIEQPLHRSVALDPQYAEGIQRLCGWKPVILDESDGTLTTYREAIGFGYRGVSSKNCKGPTKSLLNAGLTWLANDRGQRDDCLMTGEDLCSVGVIPVQADLALAATLGLSHVERNGHHYHPGLSYLPFAEQEAALAAHGDFYAEQHGRVSPRLVDGKFQIASLHCPGFGFAVEPDINTMTPADEWQYESLGIME